LASKGFTKLNVSAPIPCSAALRMVARFEQAVHSGGCGFLGGLGHDVAGGHGEELARVPRVGSGAQHLCHLPGGLIGHRLFVVRVELEPEDLRRRARRADAPFDAAVADQIERGQSLGHPGRMVVLRWHEPDAMTDADVRRQRRGGGQEHFGRRGVGVLLQEMVLGRPHVLDAQFVGQDRLLEGFGEGAFFGCLVPRPRKLNFEKYPEPHGCSPQTSDLLHHYTEST